MNSAGASGALAKFAVARVKQKVQSSAGFRHMSDIPWGQVIYEDCILNLFL